MISRGNHVYFVRFVLFDISAEAKTWPYYGWQNSAKFTKFIFIHIQCSYWYSRMYLFTFNTWIYIQKIFITGIHYICSYLRDVFIHIQRVISIHIHDRNIQSAFSAHHLCTSFSPSLTILWLAKWCKVHKVYIHSHSVLLLIFTNIFIHLQQPNLHSRNIVIHIYPSVYFLFMITWILILLTFTRCLHSHSACFIHSHSRSKQSFSIFCAPPLCIIRS